MSNIGRAKRSEYRIDPPPTMIEKFNHHINLKRQCLAYITFLCWLIDFDVLIETIFACEPCLRSCLLHDLPIIQAILKYADQELSHLNQLLQFQLCCEHPHLPPPRPPTPKPPTPKPSTPHSPPPEPPHCFCCDHCTRTKHTTYLLLIFLVPLAVALTLFILYIRNNWTSRWLFCLLILALICHLLIRHYIRSSLDSIRETFSAYVSETKKAIVAALVLLTAFLQC